MSKAHEKAAAAAARQNYLLERSNLMLGRSFMSLGMMGMTAYARLNAGNKEVAETLAKVQLAMSFVSMGFAAYSTLLRIQYMLHKRNTAAITEETIATNALAGARMRAGGAGIVAGRGGGGGLGVGGLAGRLGMSGMGLAGGIGGGLLAGALGAEFLAPAIVLALRGKDPFGSEYKTLSSTLGGGSGRQMPAASRPGVSFTQQNTFNAPVTNESVRQLDDANKRFLRTFGESP